MELRVRISKSNEGKISYNEVKNLSEKIKNDLKGINAISINSPEGKPLAMRDGDSPELYEVLLVLLGEFYPAEVLSTMELNGYLPNGISIPVRRIPVTFYKEMEDRRK